MRISECKPGMFVRAVRNLEDGYWATGLILGRIERVNSAGDLTVRFVTHARHKEWEGGTFYCKAPHLVQVSNPTANEKIEINTDFASLFE